MNLIKNKTYQLYELINSGAKELEKAGIEEGRGQARLLLEELCGYSGNEFFMHQIEAVSDELAAKYFSLIEKRSEGIPIQHLIGKAWFYGREFFVNENVLIPRFDTEILVEEALGSCCENSRVLDLCTGSGCILITLCKEAKIQGAGSDISEAALAVAAKNARKHEVSCRFIQSDLFDRIDGEFDLIVSNPPYIPTRVIRTLQKEVADHDPLLALDGGEDGLFFYKKIISEAPKYLADHGSLLLEIGYDQGEKVAGLMKASGFLDVNVIKDLSGNDRVVRGCINKRSVE